MAAHSEEIHEQLRLLVDSAHRAASRGSGRVSPNPLVGAALLDRSGRVHTGAHTRFGGPHAERRLLERLGSRAAGGHLYITLEPCSYHGKTPPCTAAVLAAKPSRVTLGILDPNRKVRGRGLRRLRQAGIEVAVGPGATQTVEFNLPFFSAHLRNRSWVTLKLGSSLDGKVATDAGESRWITGEESRRQVHEERSLADAVVVGAGTVRADDPELTVRNVNGPDPSRIVVDSNLWTQPDCRIWSAWSDSEMERPERLPREGNHVLTSRGFGRSPSIILATAHGTDPRRLKVYRDLGWEIWLLPRRKNGHVSLTALARKAAARGLLHLYVEGGPGLSGGLLEARLVDEVSLYIAPKILGGSRSWTGSFSAPSLKRVAELERIGSRPLGSDVWIQLRRSGIVQEMIEGVHRTR